MIDHAQRINELREVAVIERYAAPMLIAIVVALALIIGSVMLDIYAAKRYEEQIKAAVAFAACLSGAPILLGDEGVASCRVVNSVLVKGLK